MKQIAWLFLGVLLVPTVTQAADVTITVDATVEHQTWHGFGATHMVLVYVDFEIPEDRPPDGREVIGRVAGYPNRV